MSESETPPRGARTAAVALWLLLAMSIALAVVSWLLYATGRLPVR